MKCSLYGTDFYEIVYFHVENIEITPKSERLFIVIARDYKMSYFSWIISEISIQFHIDKIQFYFHGTINCTISQVNIFQIRYKRKGISWKKLYLKLLDSAIVIQIQDLYEFHSSVILFATVVFYQFASYWKKILNN